MPLFYIPKPRRFQYEPRFYDPDKERWEAMKARHALQNDDGQTMDDSVTTGPETADKELEYFQERVRRFDELSTHQRSRLTWRDMFRKREMPEFHYTPRFIESGELRKEETDAEERLEEARRRAIRIKRRFDVSRTLQRKQQAVWVKVALVLVAFYLVYRFYGPITQFLLRLFF